MTDYRSLRVVLIDGDTMDEYHGTLEEFARARDNAEGEEGAAAMISELGAELEKFGFVALGGGAFARFALELAEVDPEPPSWTDNDRNR